MKTNGKINIKFVVKTLFLLFLVIGTILIIRHQHRMPYQKNSGFVFGTVYNITYQFDDDLKADIEKVLKDVDNSLSPFNDSSVIARINRNEDVRPDEMFTDVFTLAQSIAEETDGAFDITVAPLVNVWGFGFKNGTEPTSRVIDSLRAFVGYEKVSYAGKIGMGKIRKSDPRVTLDCSAIAKGYGCDVVAAMLASKGITNYMVEIGGEVVTSGVSVKRVPWRIGVVKPVDDTLGTSHEMQTVLNITDKAMATSGNYRNFYYKDGKKYAHTIDPATGYPVQHNLLSATVVTDRCATADAYATAFMVMGVEKAKAVLEHHPELMAYLIYIDNDGQYAVWQSPKMKLND